MQFQPVALFQLTSNAFVHGSLIPAEHTCDGESSSPHLAWSEPPPNTRSFALIMEDPDAPRGTFVHWVVYDLPGDVREVPANLPAVAELPNGGRQGRNSAGRTGYFGPCPPSGRHRYVFRLYALDAPLKLASGVNKEQLAAAMAGHELGRAELMAVYGR